MTVSSDKFITITSGKNNFTFHLFKTAGGRLFLRHVSGRDDDEVPNVYELKPDDLGLSHISELEIDEVANILVSRLNHGEYNDMFQGVSVV